MASYNDQQLMYGAKIAYADFGPTYDKLCAETGRTEFTIQELLDNAPKGTNVSPIKEILDGYDGGSEILSWKIVGKRDTNSTTGFYGCIIDTGGGEAMVAFRGSEGMDSRSNLEHDWVEADIGLLASVQTKQQSEVDEMLKEYKDKINSYDSVDMTGHSLGGNLAAYATLVSDKHGIGDKVGRCTSFDGPGFSKEFIAAHALEIAKNAKKIDHYKYSMVGSMLNDLPGENSKFIKVKQDKILGKFDPLAFVHRHSTDYIEFDENGNVKKGHQDAVAFLSMEFTRLIDNLPTPVGFVVRVLTSEAVLFASDHPKLVLAGFLGLVILNPALMLGIVAVIAFVAITIIAVEYIVEFVAAIVDKIVDAVTEMAKKVINWAKEKFEQFKQAFKDAVMKTYNWFKEKFSARYRDAQRYIAANHVLRFDTNTLVECANRLSSLNTRLDVLDSRLNTLYKQVRWRDLMTLQSADHKIGKSKKLEKCAFYLAYTAQAFDEAERKVLEMLG